MKKKLLLFLFFVLISFAAVCVLSACGVSENVNSVNEGMNSETAEEMRIVFVDGGTVNGTDIYMFIEHDEENVPLLGKIKTNRGEWRLYSDIIGQHEIPTKIAAGSSGKLANGYNKFYIMLNDGEELMDVYTLTIYRSFAVDVSYYDDKGVRIYSDTAYTGHEYIADYNYDPTGYTFIRWMENGKGYVPRVLWGDLYLEAEMTANEYKVTLDADGGDVDCRELIVTYGAEYTFPTPMRTGYTFVGWYYDNSLCSGSKWNIAKNVTVTAHWEENRYNATAKISNNRAGNVFGSGEFDYGTSVIFTATVYDGYDFLGWYDGEALLTSALLYEFVVPAKDVTYTAKYTVKEEMENFYFYSTATSCRITGIKDKSVRQITVPDYVTDIDDAAFDGCIDLTNVVMKSGVASISNHMFDGCINLRGIIIGNNVTRIGDYAFNGCIRLTSVTIPDSVTAIGDYAFAGCTGLINVTIGNNVTDIGNYSFCNCYNLVNIVIPDSVTSVREGTFSGCRNLMNTIIPNGVKSIEKLAFYGCASFTDMTIPDSVTSIGEGAFSGCSSLENITLPFVGGSKKTSLNTYQYPFGFIFGSSYPNGTAVEQKYYGSYNTVSTIYYIPSSLRSVRITSGEILRGAFYNCNMLTDIIIPTDITVIHDAAFFGCTSLLNIDIPDNVTQIGAQAFYRCRSLTSVIIPNGVTKIENWAFQYCTGLINVVIESGSLDNYAFANCENLISVDIGDSVKVIGHCAFGYCKNLVNVIIGGSVEIISDWAFHDCISLTDIIIPKDVANIGANAFLGCINLASVTFENPNEWKAGDTVIPDTALLNLSTAADFLVSVYCNSVWVRE